MGEDDGDREERVAVGVGVAECDRGGLCANVDVGVDQCRWLAGFTWWTGAGMLCETGRAMPMPTMPVNAPAAALVVARTAVVRRCRPP